MKLWSHSNLSYHIHSTKYHGKYYVLINNIIWECFRIEKVLYESIILEYNICGIVSATKITFLEIQISLEFQWLICVKETTLARLKESGEQYWIPSRNWLISSWRTFQLFLFSNLYFFWVKFVDSITFRE